MIAPFSQKNTIKIRPGKRSGIKKLIVKTQPVQLAKI
jgi:hypothetical protein